MPNNNDKKKALDVMIAIGTKRALGDKNAKLPDNMMNDNENDTEDTETEDAVFGGAIETLCELGLPKDLETQIRDWYSSDEADESKEQPESQSNEPSNEGY